MVAAPEQSLTPEQWEEHQDARARMIAEARRDPVIFAGAVLRDELTGHGISLAPMHLAWHDLATVHDRLVVWAHVEGGKSQQMSIARTLFQLAQNPNLRGAVVSNTATQAEKLLRAIRTYVERSQDLHDIAPKLRRGEPWTDSAITVRRDVISKDPTLQACGVHGNILGSRLDWLVLDDVLDFENTLTDAGRKQVIAWYNAALAGRLTANARVIVVGTAYYPDDLLHHLGGLPGWAAFRYPVVDEDGTPRWPERWSLERIQKARSMGPVEFARQLLCKPRSDEDAKFKRAWIDRCLALGAGRKLAHSLSTIPDGWRTITGVDLGVQQHSAADPSCLFTIAIAPDGTREVLCCESGRWSGPDIVNRIVDAHRRYHSLVVVENNAAQDFIVQFMNASFALPIQAYTTGRSKAHPEFGVEGIAAEMSQGKWIIPNVGGVVWPELQGWIDEMLFYDPRAHTGDRLMASFLAREGARMLANEVKVEVRRQNLLAR